MKHGKRGVAGHFIGHGLLAEQECRQKNTVTGAAHSVVQTTRDLEWFQILTCPCRKAETGQNAGGRRQREHLSEAVLEQITCPRLTFAFRPNETSSLRVTMWRPNMRPNSEFGARQSSWGRNLQQPSQHVTFN
jgi:hypothetical protein